MSYSKLINPKKKRRVFATKESPFPVPIASITRESTSEKQWLYYTGNLVGNQVMVHHSGDINFLYKMGFFGKGTLSRSKPEFNQRCKLVSLPKCDGEINTYRVTSRRSYLRRLNWQNAKSGDPELEEYDSSQEVEFLDDEINHEEGETENDMHVDTPSSNKDNKESNNQGKDLIGPVTNQSFEGNEWSAAVESWDKAEADEDFWGVDPTEETNKNQSSSNLRTITNDLTGKRKRVDEWEDSREDVDFWCSETSNVLSNQDKDASSSQTKIIPSKDFSLNSAAEENVQVDEELSELVPNVGNHDINKQTEISHRNLTETTEMDTMNVQTGPDKELTDKKGDEQGDPLCESDEEDGELFVMEDSENESENRKRKWKELSWKPVVKEDPYYIKEFLHLTFQESFYLAYGLGCLRVYENDKLLNLSEMWGIFCQRQNRFVSLYVAYHYFRSKGWVPKTGLKFGADFIIYKEGPPFYHGSYSVLVKMVDENLVEEENSRTLTWTQLAGLNRLTEHVAKELMICYVIRPSHLTQSDLMSSPRVISQFKVKEMVVSRWVSSQERESKNLEEIP
ncbi:tRNA-splicing endonuclease subunit Sen2-like [Saccostrea echinata]|uniref:tRNA-splicing endonuclease subunit Sen2-like n=1 Tax=Saccostrea echinata TaxID=191078 RepID=UPI002A80F4FD|nr:tRNA-splicing endonuclease subunit Sen2-like [Saccostrea echinata]